MYDLPPAVIFCIGVMMSRIIFPILILILKILKAVFIYGFCSLFKLTSNVKCYKHNWTVISGCTDGIGRAYLHELLKKGLRKFVLVSRNPQKLNLLCEEIHEKYINAELETFAFDFTTHGYQELQSFINKFTVELLVNMAGVGPHRMEKYGVMPEQDTTILTVNIMAAAKLMQIVLPQMRNRKCGTIVNMASSQSFAPVPLLASYSASKIAIVYLSEAIRYENKNNDIKVQCLIPLLVATKMSKYESAGCFVISSEDYARQAVHSLHMLNHTTGCFSHELQMALLELVSWPILRPLAMLHYRDQQKRINAI